MSQNTSTPTVIMVLMNYTRLKVQYGRILVENIHKFTKVIL